VIRVAGLVLAAVLLPAGAWGQAPAAAASAVAAPAPALPDPTQPATPAPPPPQWLPRPGAELRALDKISAVPTTIRLKVGDSAQFGSLTIRLLGCMVRPPDQPEDATAFLDVQDSRAGEPGFHGWMFAKEPELSVLEHPVYDLRLIGCTNNAN
jgi:hypothetical protein